MLISKVPNSVSKDLKYFVFSDFSPSPQPPNPTNTWEFKSSPELQLKSSKNEVWNLYQLYLCYHLFLWLIRPCYRVLQQAYSACYYGNIILLYNNIIDTVHSKERDNIFSVPFISSYSQCKCPLQNK